MQNDSHSFYYQGTNGKGVLLIHGLTGSPSEMKYVGKKLHKLGFTVYAPTLAGHCKDEAALLKTGWKDWHNSVLEAYHHLNKEVDEVYAAGICAGASLALYLAAQRNVKLAGVALYSMTFRYNGWNIPKTRILLPLLPIVVHLPILRNMYFKESFPYGIKDSRLRDRIMNNIEGEGLKGVLDNFPYRSMNQLYRLNDAVRRNLPKISTPTLVMHAREDDMSHPRNSQHVAEKIGGPCKVHWLEDSYHMIHVDQERKKVVELTAEFFGAAEPA